MPRLIAFLIFLASITSAQTPQWMLFEASLEASRDYENPIQDVQVNVSFTSPSGGETAVPAFWDGGRTWRARFSPNETGTWTYRWSSSDSEQSLDGKAGTFECVPYSGTNPLYVHGRVDVSPAGRHFAYADGAPFFWLGDTAWNGVTLSDGPGWDAFLDDRRSKHFSVIQFVALPWRSASGNADGRPAFYGKEKIEIEAAYFRRMDERVAAINRHGLLAAPVMFWTHSSHVDLNPGMFLPEDQLVLLGRYLIARYGAYQVAWILGGDGNYTEERAARWRRVGRALFGPEANGVRRPVTVHATYWCADAFEGEEWWTFNGYQSGHNETRGLERVTQGEPTQWWKTDPRKRPVLNLEPNYEAHRNRAPDATDLISDLDVRHAVYHSLLNAPIAGVTYGAHGIWAWHPRAEEPMTHPYTGIGQPWHEAMKLPGSMQLKYMVELLSGVDWTKLRPAQELLSEQPGSSDPRKFIAVARSPESKTVIAYLPSGGQVRLQSSATEGVARARWVNPRTGEATPVRANGLFRAPDNQDWILELRP